MVALIGLSLGDSGFWFGFDIDTSPMQCMNVQIEDETEKSLFCELSDCRFLSKGKFCLQHLSKVCKSQGSVMCSGNANRLGSCSSARTG